MVLAWQTDMTRSALQIGHEMSGRAYPEVGFGDARIGDASSGRCG